MSLLHPIQNRLFKRLIILLCILFLVQLYLPLLQSQTKKQDTEQEVLQYEVTVTLKLIQVYVTDKKGNPVTDLEKSDFELYDNGKRQTITHFEKHILSIPASIKKPKPEKIKKPVPEKVSPPKLNRKIFLLFDFAFNNAAGIRRAKEAALHLIDTQLHPTDEVGVFSYSANKGLTLHEYLTTDHKKIRQVVQEIVSLKQLLGRAEQLEDRYAGSLDQIIPEDLRGFRNQEGSSEGAGRMIGSSNFKKEIYKMQVFDFSLIMKDLAKALRYIPGYKHIILFSKGVNNQILYGKPLAWSIFSSFSSSDPDFYGDPDLRSQYENMSKELGASNSPLYAVNVEGLIAGRGAFSKGLLGDYSLRRLSKESGGKYYGNTNDFKAVVEEISSLTSVYYVLSYYIDEKWDGKYHKIKVKVKRKGCEVHAQGGYFNPKPFDEYSKFEKQLHLIDLALSEKPHLQKPISLTCQTLPYLSQGKSNILILSRIPIQRFVRTSREKIEIVSIIFDKQKNIVSLQTRELRPSLLMREDVYYYNIVELSPGEYACRLVVRNLSTGKGGVGSTTVIVPEASDSGLRLYLPLLLIPEKNAFYIKGSPTEKEKSGIEYPSFFNVYPFDYNEYCPLIEELKPEVSKLLAVVRCSIINIQQPEVQFSAYLIHLSTGKKIPLSLSVLNQYQEEDIQIFLIKLPIGGLQPGKYSLYLFAEEMNTKSKSHTSTTFIVR
ncbi:MAG: VWA domain-containing protein [Candidatus Aminicenantia bacterium]